MDREQLGIVGIVDGLAQAMDEMAGHVVQHYKNILDAQAGCTPWTPRVAPSFPLIVTLEDWWIFTPTVVGLLSDSVDRRLGEAGLSPGLARDMPYTIVSIDELEIALQVISETGIAPFLNAKNDDEHRILVRQAICDEQVP